MEDGADGYNVSVRVLMVGGPTYVFILGVMRFLLI